MHSANPIFAGLPDYFVQRIEPTLAVLLLHAITQLCQPVPGRALEQSQGMVAVLIDGLRSGVGAGRSS